MTNITDYGILVVEVKSREFTPTKEASEKGIFIKEEKDLEKEMNAFLKAISEEQLLDIKYNVAAIGEDDDEQIYCFSAMIVYRT
mgnify:CR=1 FL=1